MTRQNRIMNHNYIINKKNKGSRGSSHQRSVVAEGLRWKCHFENVEVELEFFSDMNIFRGSQAFLTQHPGWRHTPNSNPNPDPNSALKSELGRDIIRGAESAFRES